MQEDLLGKKVKKVLLIRSISEFLNPSAARDVMAPELQEVSLYQLIWASKSLL